MDTTETNFRSTAQPVSPVFQIIFIAISSIAILYSINRGLERYLIKEPEPPINIFTPESVKEFGNFPEEITVGLYIDEFHTFDMVRGIFVFSGIVWFLVNPAIVTLETLNQFNFEQGTILSRGNPKTVILNKNLLIQFPVKIEIKNNLNYSHFPIDDHRVYFILNNTLMSPSNIIFYSSQREFVVKPTVHTFGWEILDTMVTVGYDQSVIDQYDEHKTFRYLRAIFAIDFARYGMRYILSILLPMLFVFYLVLFCFSISDRTRITLAAGGITAILAYRFVIETLSPSVGYFMLSDYLFFLFLGVSFAIFFSVSIEGFYIRIPLLYKKIIIILLHTTIVVSIGYLFMYF